MWWKIVYNHSSNQETRHPRHALISAKFVQNHLPVQLELLQGLICSSNSTFGPVREFAVQEAVLTQLVLRHTLWFWRRGRGTRSWLSLRLCLRLRLWCSALTHRRQKVSMDEMYAQIPCIIMSWSKNNVHCMTLWCNITKTKTFFWLIQWFNECTRNCLQLQPYESLDGQWLLHYLL